MTLGMLSKTISDTTRLSQKQVKNHRFDAEVPSMTIWHMYVSERLKVILKIAVSALGCE